MTVTTNQWNTDWKTDRRNMYNDYGWLDERRLQQGMHSLSDGQMWDTWTGEMGD